jgi:hypothetical protein
MRLVAKLLPSDVRDEIVYQLPLTITGRTDDLIPLISPRADTVGLLLFITHEKSSDPTTLRTLGVQSITHFDRKNKS